MGKRAWKIECDDIDSHGECVVFAESRSEARRRDSRENCDCEFIDIRIARAKEFDSLSPGPISRKEYLDRGWFFWCGACGRQLHGEDVPVVVGEHVFCNRDCVTAERSSYPADVSEYHKSIVSLCRKIDAFLEVTPPPPAAAGD